MNKEVEALSEPSQLFAVFHKDENNWDRGQRVAYVIMAFAEVSFVPSMPSASMFRSLLHIIQFTDGRFR